MYVYFNPNPVGRTVGDCVVRAIAKALDISWEDAFALVCTNGFRMGDMPSSDSVWGSVLRQHGFYKKALQGDDTADDFCRRNPKGVFVLGFGGHTATVVDGNLYDSWNSLNEIPIYVWYEKEV